MTLVERRYGVWLHRHRIGTLNQRGDYTWFGFAEEYLAAGDRPTLGLIFEQNPDQRFASALRLPPWFSNLLPEGLLRTWIAKEREVSADREMELLAQVGGDLPGAVQVLPEDEAPEGWHPVEPLTTDETKALPEIKFSLAGVTLKFSMLRMGDRVTLPASGEGGDWIVKLPNHRFRDVPRNEYAMMTLANLAGIDTPEVRLFPRNQVGNLPDSAWPDNDEPAYGVRRFDRDSSGDLVHIEDLAQVRNRYPDAKYEGSFETVASLCYRGRDLASLREFARRLTFNILISNGDAHLKNWSLRYPDQRVATLAPAYDLVSTAHYPISEDPEDLGLKFGRSKRFDSVTIATFTRVEERLRARGASLADVVEGTVRAVLDHWPKVADLLADNKPLQESIGKSIDAHARTLMKGRR